MIKFLFSVYTELNMLYKLMIPTFTALISGIVFLIIIVPQISFVQYQITDLSEKYIPIFEKSSFNLNQLKVISEQLIFSVLTAEAEMLPKEKDFRQIEKNLQYMNKHLADNQLLVLESLKAFIRYRKLALQQATLMISKNTLQLSSRNSKQLTRLYTLVHHQFKSLNNYLKQKVFQNASLAKQKMNKIFYEATFFIILVLLIIFFISYFIYSDFNHRISVLHDKLTDLQILKENAKVNILNDAQLDLIAKNTNAKIEQIKQLKKEKKMIETIMNKDALTKLYNRRYLEKFVRNNDMSDVMYSIIFLDIDDFKMVNDTYGHDVGDMVLQQIAELLIKIVRIEDIPIRYGGEEFLIIMNSDNEKIVRQKAEEIRLVIEEAYFDVVQHITVSIGVAFRKITVDEGKKVSVIENDILRKMTLKETIKAADEALYRAKNSGKNRVECSF